MGIWPFVSAPQRIDEFSRTSEQQISDYDHGHSWLFSRNKSLAKGHKMAGALVKNFFEADGTLCSIRPHSGK